MGGALRQQMEKNFGHMVMEGFYSPFYYYRPFFTEGSDLSLPLLKNCR